MLINVHNLLHVQRSVLQLGPLWANSSFEFEDANGDLKALFHGSQNIDMQVTTAHTLFPYIYNRKKHVSCFYSINCTYSSKAHVATCMFTIITIQSVNSKFQLRI